MADSPALLPPGDEPVTRLFAGKSPEVRSGSLDQTPRIFSQRASAKTVEGKPAYSTLWEVPGLTFDEAFWRGLGSQQQHSGVRPFGR